MTLEHLGIAVADADAAVALFERLLGHRPYKVETVEREGVRTHFLGDGGTAGRAPKLELLEALGPDSPVAGFLDKRGPGLHHLAFEVDDIEAHMARLAALGFRLLADTPKPGADSKRIVFLHPKSTAGVLVELCESIPVAPERLDVPFEDGTLAAFASGPEDAPPLVVLHAALGSTALETARLIRHWARDFRVYGLDFMSHGASDPYPGRAFTFPDFAANVVALLDAAGIAQAHGFGFSMGAGALLLAAARHPQRFLRLAVHGPNVQWDEAEVASMTGAIRGALHAPEGHWAQRLTATHGPDWPALADRLHAFTEGLPAAPFPDDLLASVAHPTLVSTGDRDRYFPLRHALHLHATLPHAALAVLPGVDHPIQTVEPQSFAALVRQHLIGDPA